MNFFLESGERVEVLFMVIKTEIEVTKLRKFAQLLFFKNLLFLQKSGSVWAAWEWDEGQ